LPQGLFETVTFAETPISIFARVASSPSMAQDRNLRAGSIALQAKCSRDRSTGVKDPRSNKSAFWLAVAGALRCCPPLAVLALRRVGRTSAAP
jgi:hypothetical protein